MEPGARGRFGRVRMWSEVGDQVPVRRTPAEPATSYQNVVRIGFDPSEVASTEFPDWVSEGTATYLATLYAGYGEANTFGAWRRWIGGSD